MLNFNRNAIEALSEDQTALWKRVNDSRFLTLNEQRQMVGYEAIPNGDVLSQSPKPT
jgi:phage portal protein BeeE